MTNQTNLHSIKLLPLAFVAAITIIFGAAFPAFAQDKIEYNQVYECPVSGARFKVLNCKGPGQFDSCETFTINELSSGGGIKGSFYRGTIEYQFLSQEGCTIKGRPAVNNQPNGNEQSENQTPVSTPDNNRNNTLPNKENNSSVACSASDPDANGRTANEKTFRGVIRRLWEKEAREGMDGTVSITFQKMVVGAPRAWRANLSDAYSQANPKKPIYPVRATFATCTDYKSAVSKRKMERIYDCFVHKTGGWQCTQTGASGALALKDEEQYIQKKRQ
jgi:hypothetical protein